MLTILGIVASYVKDQKLVTQGWYEPLDIVIYPINPDNSPIVQRYIDSLKADSYTQIDEFISRESKKYDIITSKPTRTRLGDTLSVSPPEPPPPNSSRIDNILWSLRLRYWVWKNAPAEPDDKYLIRMFVLYHDPATFGELKHSVGLQKGLVGIVNAYGVKSQSTQNNMVITHEFLHTVGASDKYDSYGQPVIPDGLGNPDRSPRFPQKKAEIMAGKRAISATSSEMPFSFRQMVIGTKTAQEIGWLNSL